jgi:Protein of unknown function (DUF3558)
MVVATGCTTTSAGSPLPDPSTETSTNSQPNSGEDLPSDGAPKVEKPLDVSHFEENPCEVLTSDDAHTLNVPPNGESGEVAFGKSCNWRNKETRGSVRVQFYSSIKRGLSAVYEEAKELKFPYFERIDDIDGQPAVAFDTKSEKPTGFCTVAVGVSDQLAFDVLLYLSDGNVGKTQPCDKAAQVAGMMMKTMRETT